MTVSINEVKAFKFQKIEQNSSSLIVFEKNKFKSFNFSRIFSIVSSKKEIRGRHAHKECIQILHCLCGEIEVNCSDGYEEKKFLLNKVDMGVYIPAGIWSYQNYLSDFSVLNVYCNMIFKEDDYIRDYNIYKKNVTGKIL